MPDSKLTDVERAEAQAEVEAVNLEHAAVREALEVKGEVRSDVKPVESFLLRHRTALEVIAGVVVIGAFILALRWR